jgi:two-component system sensor histidine kinase/response regulator
MTDRDLPRRKLRNRSAAGRSQALRAVPGNPADVRARRQATKATRPEESAETLGLLQVCPDPILVLREDCIRHANPAALALFRADSAEALNGVHWHRLLAAEHWALAELHCGTPAAGESGRQVRMELSWIALDGSTLIAESSSCLVTVGGKPAVMLVLRDITGQRRADAERRAQQAALEQQMIGRTDDLRQALADARLADQAKDAFLANVSHELRTPLSAMIGLLDLSRKHCSDPTLHGYLDTMSRAGKHLSRIIDDLLDLSKIVAGRMEIEEADFSLRDMLHHAQEVLSHKAEAKGLQLKFRVDQELPDAVCGDPLRIEQILLNLIGNAIKFTQRGQVDVHASLTTRSEAHVRLAVDVADTGIGMTPKEISGLFQPFAQATATVSRNYGGTGLGLALSQRLAEAMGGRITVRSRKDEGSVFSFGLRLALGGTRPSAPPTPQESPANYSRARVLLVDDDPLNIEIVTAMLQTVGIYPQIAGNGHEAMTLLAAEGPAAFDLVLMDIQMPVLDGHSATRLIRGWQGFGSLPIVALTAHALEHERQGSLRAGMNDHVSKPFDLATLQAILAKWLPQGRPAAAAPLPPPPVAPTAVVLSTLKCLDYSATLSRFNGNEQRYRHWLGKFIEESPALAPKIRNALATGRRDEAVTLAHTFKGSTGTLGLEKLKVLAQELEAAIRHGRPAVPELRQLERAIDEARFEIAQALAP